MIVRRQKECGTWLVCDGKTVVAAFEDQSHAEAYAALKDVANRIGQEFRAEAVARAIANRHGLAVAGFNE